MRSIVINRFLLFITFFVFGVIAFEDAKHGIIILLAGVECESWCPGYSAIGSWIKP